MYERNYSNARRQPPASANTSGGLLGDGGPPLRVCQVLNCPTLRPSSTPAQGHLASRVELSTDTWRPLSSSLKPAFTQEQMNEKEGEGRRPLLPALNGFSLQSSFWPVIWGVEICERLTLGHSNSIPSCREWPPRKSPDHFPSFWCHGRNTERSGAGATPSPPPRPTREGRGYANPRQVSLCSQF